MRLTCDRTADQKPVTGTFGGKPLLQTPFLHETRSSASLHRAKASGAISWSRVRGGSEGPGALLQVDQAAGSGGPLAPVSASRDLGRRDSLGHRVTVAEHDAPLPFFIPVPLANPECTLLHLAVDLVPHVFEVTG